MGNISVPWKTVKRYPEQSFDKKKKKMKSFGKVKL